MVQVDHLVAIMPTFVMKLETVQRARGKRGKYRAQCQVDRLTGNVGFVNAGRRMGRDSHYDQLYSNEERGCFLVRSIAIPRTSLTFM